ncbi:MAG: spore coat protein CotJB [Ruminococcus sp.]|nr:spore coat protein CotJB [Ruminococcus sp.]
MNDRQRLMTRIKQYDFTLKELNLYLDTHPTCRRALAMFRRYKALREEALSEYTERFGPITPEQSSGEESWSWIADPWPWERS